MKRFIALVALAMTLVFANVQVSMAQTRNNSVQTVDLSNLSPSEQEAIQKLVAAKQVPNSNHTDQSLNIDDISKYADLGVNIGKAIGGVAKEVGVEINNFANSDVGRLATFIIIFKLVGMEFLGLIVGPIAGLVGMLVGWKFVKLYGTPRETIRYKRNKAGEIESQTTEIIHNIESTTVWRVFGFLTMVVSWITALAIML